MTDSPFRIGDRVERLVRLLDGADLLNDGVGGVERVEAHRALRGEPTRSMSAPQSGWKCCGGLVLHPAGEALVEPQIVPPRHGDEVAEPLVRHLVGFGAEDVLALALAGDRRVVSRIAYSKVKIAPQFSIAPKNCDWPGPATLSSLGSG